MPSRIAAKVQSRPGIWNTWSGRVTLVTTRNRPFALPPPDFLPSHLMGSMPTLPPFTDAPRAAVFDLASHPATKRTTSQMTAEEEQHTKKAKV